MRSGMGWDARERVAAVRQALEHVQAERRAKEAIERRAFPEVHGFTKGDADELRGLASWLAAEHPPDRRKQAKYRRLSENLRKVAEIVARIED